MFDPLVVYSILDFEPCILLIIWLDRFYFGYQAKTDYVFEPVILFRCRMDGANPTQKFSCSYSFGVLLAHGLVAYSHMLNAYKVANPNLNRWNLDVT